ncbi:MAG TPA: hypothetical protein VI114_08235 [Chthoniobacterales bacterium]
MSQLFDDLAKLDRNIANRWKTRTRDNEKHILSARDIDFILADVIRAAHTTDITEKQGTAIVLLINASIKSDDLKSAAAVDRLVYYVNLWEQALRLNLQPILAMDALLPIADFLRNGVVSRVMFKSPGTGISYAPFDYIAVGQLILNGDVTVYMSKTGGLSSLSDTVGAYYHEENMFLIYNMDPRSRRVNFVHEGTHIIQDWEDVSSLAHYQEADAFIAQAIAELALAKDYPAPPPTDEVGKTSLAAAQMVIDKTAVDSNADWQTKYDHVVKAVGRRYKLYGIRVDNKKGETRSESTKFKQLLKEIKIANDIRDEALRKTAGILLEVLP